MPVAQPKGSDEAGLTLSEIEFYGASDDLVEVEGDAPGCDEYPSDDATFVVAGLRVRVHYPTDCWAIEVNRLDEDVPVTAEEMKLSADGYSMHLTIQVPDGTAVVREARPDA